LGREKDLKESFPLKLLLAKYIVAQCYHIIQYWNNILDTENISSAITSTHKRCNYLRMLNWLFLELSSFPAKVKKRR